jgi:hypothetical protein
VTSATHPPPERVSEQDLAHARRAMRAITDGAGPERRAAFAELREIVRRFVSVPDWRRHTLSIDLITAIMDLGEAIEHDAGGQDPEWRVRAAVDAVGDLIDTILRELEHAVLEDAPTAAHQAALWLAPAGDRQVAALLGVDARTVRSWRAQPPREVRADPDRVVLVAQIAYELRRATSAAGIVRWFSRRRPQLGGRSPLDLLERGVRAREDRLRDLARGARGQLAA